MAGVTHHAPEGIIEVDPAWVGKLPASTLKILELTSEWQNRMTHRITGLQRANILPLHSLHPSERIDTKMGADTMPSRTGNVLGSGAWYPIRLTSSRKYPIPNDEPEQERVDIIHHIYLLMLDGKLVRAPIDDGIQRILDIGTGTGIWAIDVAETYPSAQVIGTDLSPIQPSWVPPNVSFQIDDAESDWTFARDSFDLIHFRHLNGGIKDWGKLIKQSFDALKPGGWLDVAEFEGRLKSDDGTLLPEGNLSKYYDLLNEAADKSGQGFNTATSLDSLILDAGFDKVNHEVVKLSLGTWPADKRQKDMGAYMLLLTESGFESYGMALLTRTLGMDVLEAGEFITGAKKESRSKKVHSDIWQNRHLYYAQKPLKKSDLK
ncbi:S-adenosyl-L-methionine-dependent methyltransferase [Tuber borchii]|uniref:S-adenosyl-L-methionine-dependent methyltransferase n=1 Tax=Tuber borchii TaxID=42251 RepID=A0A2T7A436_TUBBO|nr:S-adenosyl-L-methionine-dependent methyltransferase [Tuber borchii]